MTFKRTSLVLLGMLILVVSVQAAENEQATDPKWTGSINAGLTATSGNTKTDSISLGINAERRDEKTRITVGGDYAKSNATVGVPAVDTKVEDWWRAIGKYDYFLTPVWYGFLNGRYETDSIANLDSRLVYGAGAGRQLIESEKTNLSCELGLAQMDEEYGTTPGTSNSEVTAQASYKLTHQLVDTVQLIHDLTYYPSINKVSDYYLTTTAELRANFTETMFANFKVIYGRDSTPALGQGASDTKYILGVGMGF
jgi:putative salt-induced outer membrane protein YdiY